MNPRLFTTFAFLFLLSLIPPILFASGSQAQLPVDSVQHYIDVTTISLTLLEKLLLLFGVSSSGFVIWLIRYSRSAVNSFLRVIDKDPRINNKGIRNFALKIGEKKAAKRLSKIVVHSDLPADQERRVKKRS